jgi:hypothetical protein
MLEARFAREWGEAIDAEARKAGEGAKPEELAFIIEELSRARSELKDAWIVQLPLELAIVRITQRSQAQAAFRPSSAVPSPAKSANPEYHTAPEIGVGSGFFAADANASQAGLDHILGKWNEVLARVLTLNHSLSLILRVCQPRSVRGNQVCLAFKYKFHKDRIETPQIRKMVEDTLREVYLMPLEIITEIDETLEVSENGHAASEQAGSEAITAEGGSSEVINNLLKTFGGKIIE